MNFNIFKKRKNKASYRSFSAAKVDRLTASWTATSQSINEDLKAGGKVLRARARDLSLNNSYARKYLALVVANVVGNKGIVLQSKAKNSKGKADSTASKLVEKHWKDWHKSVNCSVDGRLSFLEMQKLFIETAARDGEALIRIYRDKSKYGLKLHFLDCNRLDETYNLKLKNGNQIEMGIEMNASGMVVAYHLLTASSSSYFEGGREFERVLADDIIHCYKIERPEQIRAGTWMASVMGELNMLGAFFEAELVASRISASKMGFYTSVDGDSYEGDEDEQGYIIDSAEPGVFQQLPTGTSFTAFDPQHPNTAFDTFVKSILRSVAGGLRVSYNSLASDLEGVSFSSIRSGTLEERDQWRVNQQWMIEHFLVRVYDEWLKMFLLSGVSKFTFNDHEKLSDVRWQPRGWSWVDPLKDTNSSVVAINAGIKTLSDVISEQGGDIEDTFARLQYEKELAKSYGLNLTIEKEGKKDEKQN